MVFKVVFIAHAPDADPEKHKCVVETSKYKLFSVVVKNQDQAVEVSKKLVEKEGVQSIILCPGFKYSDVSEIAEAVWNKAGVFVARGDGPSNKISAEVRRREGLVGPRSH